MERWVSICGHPRSTNISIDGVTPERVLLHCTEHWAVKYKHLHTALNKKVLIYFINLLCLRNILFHSLSPFFQALPAADAALRGLGDGEEKKRVVLGDRVHTPLLSHVPLPTVLLLSQFTLLHSSGCLSPACNVLSQSLTTRPCAG